MRWPTKMEAAPWLPLEEQKGSGQRRQRQREAHRQQEGTDEEGGEGARVVAQVHEEEHDERELAHRHHDEKRYEDGCERADVDDRELERRDDGQDGRHLDVRPDGGVLGRSRPRPRVVLAHGTRYTSVKIAIHTTSTKCQYSPAISTFGASTVVSR